MAHKGRAYPLHSARVWNAEAPYPLWCPLAYEFRMPLCTGLSADHLSQIVWHNVQGTHSLAGLHYAANFSVVTPFIATYFLDVIVGWANTATDARTVRVDLTVTIFPIGFPPVTTLFGQSIKTFSNVQPLHLLEETWSFVDDPTFWNPAGGYQAFARPWPI